MILDTLARAHHYTDLHPLFQKALEVLNLTDLAGLPAGRHEIDGDRLFLLIDHTEGLGPTRARLEHHRRYIDIQICLDGHEVIGWMPIECCQKRDGEFDSTKDVGFFAEEPHTWISVRPGQFVILFPADAHAPLAGTGPLKKAILKVLV